jgi:pimeloyl-ACP methyl ester carboxylesterase
LACVSDQVFESAGDHDEEHAAAVVPDGIVIEDCGVDPNVEQPDAFLDALRAELDGR